MEDYVKKIFGERIEKFNKMIKMNETSVCDVCNQLVLEKDLCKKSYDVIKSYLHLPSGQQSKSHYLVCQNQQRPCHRFIGSGPLDRGLQQRAPSA